jgi:hypothetical protein
LSDTIQSLLFVSFPYIRTTLSFSFPVGWTDDTDTTDQKFRLVTGTMRFLVRAVGPTLTEFGAFSVAVSVLEEPDLEHPDSSVAVAMFVSSAPVLFAILFGRNMALGDFSRFNATQATVGTPDTKPLRPCFAGSAPLDFRTAHTRYPCTWRRTHRQLIPDCRPRTRR